jgi:hypothetical protein
MNNKLAEFAGKRIVTTRGNNGHGVPSDTLVSVTKSDEKKNRTIVRVSLHARAVKQLGWQDGDRVCINVTDSGAIVLARNNTMGRQLVKATGCAGRRYLRFAVVPEFYQAIPVGAGREVEIADGAIAFVL